MRRIYCDGCWRAGIETDMTDWQPSEMWVVQITRAERIDLCRKRCAPIWEKFVNEKDRLVSRQSEEFRSRLKGIQDACWKEVENAPPAEK